MNTIDNDGKIDVIFCDDSMMPTKVDSPPLTADEEERWESFFQQLDKKYGVA